MVEWTGLIAEGVVLLAFLAGSAFFSLSETAMIGVNRHRVRQLAQGGDARAVRLDRMLDEPERILSTVLIGNNLVNIGATAFATVVAVGLFGGKGALIATGVMAVLIILVSELLPKTLAVQNPLPVAMAIAPPLRIAEAILKPLVGFATWLSKAVARAVGVDAKGSAPYITPDEIEMIVRMGVEQGEVAKFEQRVISELFQFTETDVHKVMTPASQVHWLPKEATMSAAAEMASKEGRTRILVADGDFDHVLGCVHVRDLLRFSDLQLDRKPVTTALRGVLFAPADLSADRLLLRMQREHKLLAVIQGPDGHNIGICTVEDLLEELVGEIHDEFDAARGIHAHGDALGPAQE
ncbi:MAG: hemolysin family protein [Candidatus Thermoplasmatota archaeon]